MSTDVGAAPRRRRGFGRTVGLVVGVLVAAAIALALIGAVTPPRLNSTAVAPDALVSRPGQRLVLTLDQPFAADGLRLTVSPETPAELSVDGTSLIVRFPGILDYATTYSVAVDGVRGTATGATGSVAASFTTPDEQILLLVPGSGTEPDRIVRASATAGGAPEVVYEAQRINEFVRLGDGLVVVADDGDGPHVRQIGADGSTFELGGPEDATYRELRAAPDGRSYGVVMTSASVGPEQTVYDSVLRLVDATTGIDEELTGFDGAPLAVADWRYVRGTSSLLVRSTDRQGYLIDTAGGDPVPLGTLGTLRGFVPGTATLLTDQWPETFATDLTTGDTTSITVPDAPLRDGEVPGDFAVLGADVFALVVHVFVSDPLPRWATSYVVRLGPDGAQELFRPPAGTIAGVCVSSNAQLLAVTVSDAAAPDAPPLTFLVDTRTGDTSRTITGGRPDWCAQS